MKIRIFRDLYDIADRIKEIHKDYEIYYDTKTKKYEVYADGKLQVVSPYDALDARLITYLQKTRVERLQKILAEIDKQNLKIDMEKQTKIRDEVDYKSKSIFKYYEKHPDAKKVEFEEI